MSRTANVTALIASIIPEGITPARGAMRFEKFSFGSIRIDGTTYEHDVVIDRDEVRKRKKKPSKKFRDIFGHTPISTEESIKPLSPRPACVFPSFRKLRTSLVDVLRPLCSLIIRQVEIPIQ